MSLRVLLQKSLLALSLLPTLVLGADRVGDFSLLDQNGYFHQMSWYDDNKAIVLLVQATGDTDSHKRLADFKSLNASFDTQGIEFFMINLRAKLHKVLAIKRSLTDEDLVEQHTKGPNI